MAHHWRRKATGEEGGWSQVGQEGQEEVEGEPKAGKTTWGARCQGMGWATQSKRPVPATEAGSSPRFGEPGRRSTGGTGCEEEAEFLAPV